ncbi:ATP-dependent helicase HrpB [Hymenobacter cavernae]|uniref:ATP-dependent helicase HrpB n=1 Tax=Hymenobacter cavernae TaxID=2044852 RepID=A0ABQ1TLT3_9BACT|nr:ATP-dependent helicase HrpB [Hymenobacter cavernae]GGE96727.1 ATP-dependent helicase HrpB [Hymenobacter cavernae]
MLLPDLPIRAALPELLTTLGATNCAVLQAPPGAGKTTVVPLALLEADWMPANGRIIVLEPRRLAARAAAARMASLLGEPVGQTVGYRVRLESKISSKTRIEVATEVILTRMLQDDPALEGVAAVLFDEFHERSLQADLGLALALDAQAVLRPDLRLLIMSATLEAERLGSWLGAPVVRSAGLQHPVATHYLTPARLAATSNRPHERLAHLTPAIVREALAQHPGDVLVFLPGLADQRRTAEKLGSLPNNVDVHVLHGELPAEQQDAALRPAPAGRRKVVLATSIAETSLTIEGVQVVVDGGYARVPHFEPHTGLTSLETVPVSQAAADQRRGRAGRLGPGTCYRLWTEAEHALRPAHLPPEILTADLSGLALELALWGVQDASTLRWLDATPAAALAQARDLLMRLGALLPSGKPTEHGRTLAGLGLVPRLGHLVIRGKEAGHGATACALAALLTERDLLRLPDGAATPPDLRLRLEAVATGRSPLPGLVPDQGALHRVREAAAVLRHRADVRTTQLEPDAAGLLAALAYPDRLAQRESPERVRLVTGQRASLPAEYFGRDDVFFAVAHLDGPPALPRAVLAAPLDRAELDQHFADLIEVSEDVSWDAAAGRVVARKRRRLGALNLAEMPLANPAPEAIEAALLDGLRAAGLGRLPWSPEAQQVRERLAFLHALAPAEWPDVSDEALLAQLEDWLGPYLGGLKSVVEVNRLDLRQALLAWLPGGWGQQQELDRLAPAQLAVPTGSRITLDYSDPAAPVLAVRLQEVFGLLDTPVVGGGRVPLTLHLLSPGHRPVQVTRDLRSFWTNGYFEVRKDMRGRYPKHYWPDNPLEAEPMRGTRRQNGLK